MTQHRLWPMVWSAPQVLWCCTLALYSVLVLPRLLSAGMFVDGVVYASIARNMAEGYGSIWHPFYTATVYPVFYEHPPLGFWLQSWAYRLCGDVPAIEACWGGVLGLLILLGLAGIWRCLTPPDARMTGAWFPAMLWVLTPMTSWAMANNMLETPLTVCIVYAVWLCLHGLQSVRPLAVWGCGSGAALCVMSGVLIKGPVGLCPLAVPVLALGYRGTSRRRVLVLGGILCVMCCAMLGLLWATQPAAWEFLHHYVQRQLWASLTGAREMSRSRWEVLIALSREICVPLLVGGVLTVWSTRLRRSDGWSSAPGHLGLGYLSMAIAASFPLLLSVKQKRWYVFPSLAFYALALAVLWQPAALTLERFLDEHPVWRQRVLLGSLMLCGLALGTMVTERHALRRDVALHRDFASAARLLPARAVLSVYPTTLASNWTLVAHMQRFLKVSLTSEVGQPYLVATLDAVLPDAVRRQYAPLPLPHARTYRLFRKTTP